MSETNHRNPFVFVVGCPRSGTTLVQRMLDAHPDLTVANDTHFIPRAAKRELRVHDDPPLTPQLVEQAMDYHRFHRMGLGLEEVSQAADVDATWSAFVARLYDLRGRKAGKLLSGEKTPDYCRWIPLLHRLFPRARFLHVLRDGRDTALSAMDWAHAGKGPGRWNLWERDPVGASALWWRWQAGAGCRDGRPLGDALYHEVRYEDLVRNPDLEMKAVCRFLELPFSRRMARFHEGKTRNTPGLSAKSAWLGPTPGLRDWRRDMAAVDVAVFDAIAGELLDISGYEYEKSGRDSLVMKRVEYCLSWWKDHGKY